MFLTLIRHGETGHNAAGRLQGWTDTELSPQGQAQALALARRLAAAGPGRLDGVPPVTHLHSSDLTRARQTAEALAGALGVPLSLTPALREIHVGDWEGRTLAEIGAADAAGLAAWPVQAAPEGESAAQVLVRVRAYLEGLTKPTAAAHPVSMPHPALVTHGVVITALLAELLGWDLAQAWAERRGLHGNTALTTLRRGADGTWTPVYLACAAHLDL